MCGAGRVRGALEISQVTTPPLQIFKKKKKKKKRKRSRKG
jgi:hypothetical protein